MMYKKKLLLIILINILIFSCGLGGQDDDLIKSDQKKIYKINYKNVIIPDEKIDETVVVSFPENTEYFNPYQPEKEIDKFLATSLLSPLFYLNNQTGMPEKNLIENYFSSADRLTYYFKLKYGIKFHDNSVLTAYDVRASLSLLELILKKSKIYKEFHILNSTMSVEVLSDLEFTVKTDAPNGNLIYALCNYPIMKKEQIESIASDYKPENGSLNLIKIETLTGSGPYYLKKREADYYELRKNSSYFKKDSNGGTLPSAEKIVIRIIREKDYNMNNFSKNKIDILDLSGEQFNEFYKKGKAGFSKKYKIIDTGSCQSGIYLAFNMHDNNRYGITGNPNFRKYIYDNLLQLNAGSFKSGKKSREKTFKKNAVLNEVLKENFADENRIALRILVYEEGQNLLRTAGRIKEIFAGNREFEILINRVSYVNYMEKMLDKEAFDITLFYYNVKPGPLSYFNLLRDDLSLMSSDEAGDDFSQKINILLDDIMKETVIEEQNKKISDLKEMLLGNCQYLNIAAENKYYLINSCLRNFKVNSTVEDGMNLQTIETFFKTSGRK